MPTFDSLVASGRSRGTTTAPLFSRIRRSQINRGVHTGIFNIEKERHDISSQEGKAPSNGGKGEWVGGLLSLDWLVRTFFYDVQDLCLAEGEMRSSWNKVRDVGRTNFF
ncbi:hypothetical protein KY284_011520 [Solanum tuberosum]|nr:hypothetical protein KY284_011520 [Solanum tuberosum]